MSETENHFEMLPMSGEKVEVDGVYVNESGRELTLHRGEEFPADIILGATTWKLSELIFDNHHEGGTDPGLIAEKDNKWGHFIKPR